jgi:hypothetical protein
VKLLQAAREWWQRTSGEEETPLDGDSPAFVVSLLVHLAVLVTLGLLPLVLDSNQVSLTVAAVPDEKQVELKLPEEFYFSEQPAEEVGANSVAGEAMALSLAPVLSEMSQIPNHVEVEPTSTVATVEINNAIEVATGLHYSENMAVKGAAGEGTTGASGAIDRITHEILLSLEERKTLVVWLFDGTASLVPQRQAIHDRFEKIYEELGIIEAAGGESFAKYEDKPLLSSIVAFGSSTQLLTKKPTDNVAELREAVAGIKNDESGIENVFGAIHDTAKQYASFRYTASDQTEPERNVMLVVFTDEAGSDQNRAEDAIKMCRRWTIPVYVVGVPAPFGRRESKMKWVDPDPQFDQTPQWGVVEQGPESFLPERIKLSFTGTREDEEDIDSGFGPFALTRLCFETGGIYFAVHPNRNVNREVTRRETEAFSSYLTRFYDPEVMRKYRPDYVSVNEYQKRAKQNQARWVLIQAAAQSQLDQMESPTVRFVKSDEAAFANALSMAQQKAAALEPKINAVLQTLQLGESDREKETVLRWQAGFDLAIGRILAAKVRTETYNAMLAAAKRGLKFEDPKNNTWILKPSDEITTGSQYANLGKKARMYLERVVADHPGTPWAHLAARELKDPLSWAWTEEFTDLTPRPMGDAAGNAPPPANDAARMLQKPPPKRPPPKL